MSSADLSLIIRASDQNTERVLRQIRGELKNVGDQADHAGSRGMGFFKTMTAAGLGFLGANIFGRMTDGFSNLTRSMIGYNASMEQSKIAFETMLGSGEKASAFLKDLQAFAAKTPFEFPELQTAARRMMALGFESEQVLPLMTAIGDTVSAMGGGAEMIDRVTMSLGQMKMKGKVQAEEMLQLAEAGIPAWDMLAKKLGVDVPTAMDMVTKKAVDAETMVLAFQEGSAERFAGMMDKQSKTFSGLMSTFSDLGQQFLGKIGAPAFEVLSGYMSRLMDWFNDPGVQEGMDNFANWLGNILGGALDLAGRGLETFIGWIQEAMKWWGDFVDGWNEAGLGGALGVFADLVGSIAGGIGQAIQQIDWGAIWRGAGDAAGAITTWLGEQWSRIDWGAVWGGIADFGRTLWTSAVSIVEATTNWLAETWGKIDWSEVWAGISDFGTTLWTTCEDVYEAATEWLGEQWARIDWENIFAQTMDFEANFAGWLDTVDSKQMGQDLAAFLGNVFDIAVAGLGEFITGAQGTGAPSDFANVLRGMFTITDSINRMIGDFVIGFVGEFAGQLGEEIGAQAGRLGEYLGDMLATAMDSAIEYVRGLMPDWLGNLLGIGQGGGINFSGIPLPGGSFAGGAELLPGGLGAYPISTEMGVGYPTASGWQPHNWGQDFAVPAGTALYAPMDAIVESYGLEGGWGNRLRITLANGAKILMGHLRGFADTIYDGIVKAGEIIGWTGGVPGEYGAGYTTGAHLDLQTILANGLTIRPTDFFGIPGSLGGGGRGGGMGMEGWNRDAAELFGRGMMAGWNKEAALLFGEGVMGGWNKEAALRFAGVGNFNPEALAMWNGVAPPAAAVQPTEISTISAPGDPALDEFRTTTQLLRDQLQALKDIITNLQVQIFEQRETTGAVNNLAKATQQIEAVGAAGPGGGW